MSLLEWRDEYRLGIEEVDHEHRELIELINQLHAALVEDRDGARLEAFLGDIFAQVSAHFALEEKVMQARRYAELAPHKADHERLLDDIRDIMDEAQLQGVIDEEAFGRRLAAWFGDHFRTHDARVHRFLSTHEGPG